MKTKIYLCGPINGCTDSEAINWRELVKAALGDEDFEYLDPMRRDYRGKENDVGISKEIVDGDKDDLRLCDIVLAYCPKPSVGTSMEIFMAHENLGKTVIIVHPDSKPSPWLIEHSSCVTQSMKHAIKMTQRINKLNNNNGDNNER